MGAQPLILNTSMDERLLAVTRGSRWLWGTGRVVDCGRELAWTLQRHQDPQDRIEQDLAARDDQQRQEEQQPSRPRVKSDAAAEPGDHAAEYATVPSADQAVLTEQVVDGIHDVLSLVSRSG